MRTWVRVLISSACVCLVLAVGGASLFKFGIAPFAISSILVLLGFGLSLLVALLTIGTLFVAVLRKQPYGLFTMFIAFVICFGLTGYAAILYNKSVSNPVAYNVSTDLIDPPAFSQKVIKRRGPAANPVVLDDRKKELHKGAFDDIQTLVLNTSESRAYSAVLELVADRGWEIVTQDPEKGTIEAIATTFWFGFKDDVVIRVRGDSDAGTASVDLHSVSRIGQTDLGKNADRIRSFLSDLAEIVANELEASS